MRDARRQGSAGVSGLVFDTAWGWCGAQISDVGIVGFWLPEKEAGRAITLLGAGSRKAVGVLGGDGEVRSWESSARRELARELVAQVREYFEGRRRRFDLALDWRGRTAFQKAIWRELEGVRFGETIGYGELAARAGRGGAARAVGRAMAANPTPVIVPCHRVVGAGGALCGFSAAGGVATKRRLLDFELEQCAAVS